MCSSLILLACLLQYCISQIITFLCNFEVIPVQLSEEFAPILKCELLLYSNFVSKPSRGSLPVVQVSNFSTW